MKIEEKMAEQSLNLSEINTPEQLLDFLSGLGSLRESVPPCSCGVSAREFDRTGRFGCSHCYEHFRGKLHELVFPFHGASEHVGKRPKNRDSNRTYDTPEEQLKFLKLQFAKALELEQYEKAAELKKTIDEVNSLLSVSSLP